MNQKDKSTEKASPPIAGMADMDIIPDRFGKFELLDKLSASMGIVYKARQHNPDRIVALKLPAGGKLLTVSDRQMFEREIAVAAKLDHSAIVPVLETGIIEGTPYYTMPFIDGRDLFSEVHVEAYGWPTRLALFKKVCRTVQSLHDNRLIHRDLKPNNILVDRHHDIRLLDFGLAQAVAPHPSQNDPKVVSGTLQFMAPEQTNGQDSRLTPACDVYALGMMLYWMAAETLPYMTNDNYEDSLNLIRTAPILPPQQTGKSIAPLPFDDIILACLDKSPARRPRDAGALLQTIRRIEKTTQRIPPAAPSTSQEVYDEPVKKNLDRNTGILGPAMIISGAILLLIIGLVIWQKNSSGDKTIPNPNSSLSQQLNLIFQTPTTVTPTNPEEKTPPAPQSVTTSPGVVHRIDRYQHDRYSFESVRGKVIDQMQNDFSMSTFGSVLINPKTPGTLILLDSDDKVVQTIPVQNREWTILWIPYRSTLSWKWNSGDQYEQGKLSLSHQTLNRLNIP